MKIIIECDNKEFLNERQLDEIMQNAQNICNQFESLKIVKIEITSNNSSSTD